MPGVDFEDEIGAVERPVSLLAAWHSVAVDVADAIHLLDVAIWDYSILLTRAQPHRSGRLAVRFSSGRSFAFKGERFHLREPIVGKVIKTQTGWRFFRLDDLDSRDSYEKLSDLRVGKSLKSDPLVVRIIDALEELLSQRNDLVSYMFEFRREMLTKVASGKGLADRLGAYGVTLGDRIKLDWSLGVERAEEILLQERRERHQRYKLRKVARDVQASDFASDL